MSRSKRFVFAALTLGVSMLLAMGAAEAILRVFPIPGVGFNNYYYDEWMGGRSYPNTTMTYRNARGDYVERRVNQLGYLDHEHDTDKPEGTIRIGFFGDSYTEARQVDLESTFFRRIEDGLNARSDGPRYECLSFGTSGNSTVQCYLESQRWADSLDIDWVVYVFVENDVGDQLRELRGTDKLPFAYLSADTFAIDTSFRERYAHRARPFSRMLQYVRSHSLAAATLETRLRFLLDYGIKLRVTEAERQMAETGDDTSHLTSSVFPSAWPDSLANAGMELGKRVLVRWANETVASGRRFTVISVPRGVEMHKPIAEQDAWVGWLQMVCRRHGIEYVDPTGQLLAYQDAGREIFYDHFTPAGHAAFAEAFTHYVEATRPSAIPSPATDGSGEANVTTGPDGTVYLSWIAPGPDTTHALRFSIAEGTRWSNARTIATGRDWFVNWADFPAMAAGRDGGLAAHWLQKSADDTYAYDVKVVQSRDGGDTWSEPIVPHSDGTATEHGFVSMVPWDDGSVQLVWLDGRKFAEAGATGHDEEETHNDDGSEEPAGDTGSAHEDGHGTAEMTLRTGTLLPDGTVRDERSIDGRVCDCCQTDAARTSHGIVVVYRDRSPDEVRDIGLVRRIDGKWEAPRLVNLDGWRIPGCPVNGPAIDAAGEHVAVAWFTRGGGGASVRVAFSQDEGESFSSPLMIDHGNPLGRVDLTLLEDGSALVTWLELQNDAVGGDTEIRYRRVRRDGTMGPSFVLARTSSERASGFPRMARSGDDIYFAWTDAGPPSTVRTARVRARY